MSKSRIVFFAIALVATLLMVPSQSSYASDDAELKKRVTMLEEENTKLKAQLAKLSGEVKSLQTNAAQGGNSIRHSKNFNDPDPGAGGTEEWNKAECPDGTFVINARLLESGKKNQRVALRCRRASIDNVQH